ncbi:uncharacterized protein TRIADDRAFT_28247, partial [Trichoplax adhaerens]
VNLDHFEVLRAIGKGAFGKVCIVQKKDTKKMYAMKYMNKIKCIGQGAVTNVLREQEMLKALEYPLIVNLWFAFQDVEDIFVVLDLLLGGDLRYHIQQNVRFTEDIVKVYLVELASALDYLRCKYIIHRDLKPDNILLDEKGHAHLTDFNVAVYVQPGKKITSVTGTKPYMAPEIFTNNYLHNDPPSYSFAVDWWSLGVLLYEILTRRRPYDIESRTPNSKICQMFQQSKKPPYRNHWSREFLEVITDLLEINEDDRLQSVQRLKTYDFVAGINWSDIAEKKLQPSFIPSQRSLNCDPAHELEEMIVEPNPLHKKKKRLDKKNKVADTDVI